jgi:hypothetical protein
MEPFHIQNLEQSHSIQIDSGTKHYLSRSSNENIDSFNYFGNLRGCVSYVASGATASIQSSIALHAFRLYEFGKGTKQHPLRRPGGL